MKKISKFDYKALSLCSIVVSVFIAWFAFEIGYVYGERTGKYAKNYSEYCEEYRRSVTTTYAQEIRDLVLSFKEVINRAESERDHWRVLYEEQKILNGVKK